MRLCFHNIHYAIKVCRSGLAAMAISAAPVALGCAAPALAQQNRAEPIRAAIAEVRAEETKGKPLVLRMAQLVTQNEQKKKEYDATDAQLKGLQPRLDRYNASLAKYEAALGEYSKRVDAYSAKCVGTLPAEQYRACFAEKGELAGRKIELDRDKGALETERHAIEAELKDKTTKLAAIAKDMAANLAAWEKAQKDYQAIFARVEAIKKRLVELCAAGDQANDPFAVRLCVGVGWDGAKKDFAALTDLPPPAK